MTIKQEKSNTNQSRFLQEVESLKSNSDSFLFTVLLISLVFGSICIFSASINAKSTLSSNLSNIIKQIIVVGVGLVFYFFGYSLDIRKFNKKSVIRFGIFTGILLFVAWFCCYKQGAIANNYSWIYIGSFPLRFQPAELAKFTMILLISVNLKRKSNSVDIKSIDYLRGPIIFLVVFTSIIILLQKDNGSALVVGLITVITFLMVNDKHYFWWKLLAIVLCIGAIFLYSWFYTEAGQAWLTEIGFTTIANRFNAVIHPNYRSDASREIFYSLLGISKGNWFGVGFGNSIQKYGYLAASDTDYIFPIIVEELGIIGIIIVFVLYFALMFRLLKFAKKVETETERTFIVGTVIYLFVHLFLNIGGVSGLIPLTGIPLLLLSRGGSSLLVIMLSLGICQRCIINYNRYERKSTVEKIRHIQG